MTTINIKIDLGNVTAEVGRSSGEFTARDLAVAAYRALLGRDPEPDAIDPTARDIQARGLEVVLSHMMQSVEFQMRLGVDSGFSGFSPAMVDVDGRYLWIDLSDMAVSRVCQTGGYEPHETAFVRRQLASGDTFVDIGANIGWFTTLAAGIVGEGGRVHSFEPRDQTRSLLQRSVAANNFQERVTVHGFALAAEIADTRLLWMGGTNNPGGSRLARDADDAFEGMDGQEVHTMPLDDVAIDGRVTLLKLDVEGGEANVLRGARQLLEKHRPAILTEVGELALQHVSQISLGDYAALVDSLGYRIHALEGDDVGRVLNARDLHSEHPFNVVLMPA